MANMSQDLDLDLFNWADEPEVTEESYADVEAPIDELQTEPADEQDAVEVDEEIPVVEEDVPATEDVQVEETTDDGEEPDIEAIVKEILGDQAEVDDKVDDIKEEAQSTGNTELLSMIDDLQTMLAEKNQKIEELTKKNEITSNRFMDTYSDAENYSFYKPTIDKLNSNSDLNILVKNFDNEKATDRVVDILAKMIYDKTWVDVNEAINAAQKKSVSNSLTDIQSNWSDVVPVQEEKEKTYDRYQSLNELF